jgi:hypothetical protein
MALKEVLLLAVTRMLGGVCLAGMTADPDPVTCLRWVRPVRDYGHILLGDITTACDELLQPFDVVEFSFLRPRPDPPHSEDWIADFRHPPKVVRHLEGARRARFLRTHQDADPCQVLRTCDRSLCLFAPQWIKGCFRLDAYSGLLDARLSFALNGQSYLGSHAKGGLAVTDLRWRALGRSWLPEDGGWLEFDLGDLEVRLGTEQVYLAAGLTRSRQGGYWPIIIGVHTVPEYDAVVDPDNL